MGKNSVFGCFVLTAAHVSVFCFNIFVAGDLCEMDSDAVIMDAFNYTLIPCFADHPAHDVDESFGWPGTPTQFKVVKSCRVERNGTTELGVILSFKPPQDFSIHVLKGFELKVTALSGPDGIIVGGEICRLFSICDVQTCAGDLDSPSDTTFIVTLLGLSSPLSLYKARVYSLPKPNLQVSNVAFASQFFTSTNYAAPGTVYPGEWKTSMSFPQSVSEGHFEVTFELAPLEYGFEGYGVTIYNGTRRVHKVDIKNTTNRAIFHDVKPGVYDGIKIRPVDPYPDDPERCACYTRYTPDGSKKCEYKCAATYAIGPITLDDGSIISTTPIVSTSDSLRATTEIGGPILNEQSEYIVISVVSVIGLITTVCIVAILAFIVKKRRLKKGHGTERSSKTPVALVHAIDHDYHEKIVQRFILFLQKQCNCDVTSLTMNIPEPHLTFKWVYSVITNAQLVVIVESEAAYKLFTNETENKKHANTSQFKYAFISVMNMIIDSTHEQGYRKYVLVRFNHTEESYSLVEIFTSAVEFELMKHAKDFLFYIRGVGSVNKQPTMVCPKSNLDYKASLEEFAVTLSINEARRFEEQHPHWFQDRFGKSTEDEFKDVVCCESSDDCISSLCEYAGTRRERTGNKLGGGKTRMSDLTRSVAGGVTRKIESPSLQLDNTSFNLTSDVSLDDLSLMSQARVFNERYAQRSVRFEAGDGTSLGGYSV